MSTAKLQWRASHVEKLKIPHIKTPLRGSPKNEAPADKRDKRMQANTPAHGKSLVAISTYSQYPHKLLLL